MTNRQIEGFMRRAVVLARRAWPSPNPRVGAVIVKDGKIIGQGCHETTGTPHAEVNAIASAKGSTAGASMFVTLEPCCHMGRTGPCTQAILDAGISMVYVGQLDCNPVVAGQGIRQLRDAGLQVVEGVLPAETARLAAGHQRFMSAGLPYVIWKYAMTLDGKIATKTGASKWITSEAARRQVHKLRHSVDAIITGAGTVLADDPSLDVRLPSVQRQPVRVVFDSTASIPLDSKILKQPPQTVLVTGKAADPDKLDALLSRGVKQIQAGSDTPDPAEALKRLADEFDIREALLECGPTLAASFLRAGLINEAVTYIGPSLFGSAEAPGPLAGSGVSVPGDAVQASINAVRRVGDCLEIRYTF